MSYTYSLILVTSAAHKATVEAAGAALGHSGQEYSVPLAPTSAGPATHYACAPWATRMGVLTMLGSLPEDDEPPTDDEIAEMNERLSAFTSEQIAALRAVITGRAVNGGDPQANFATVLADMGLVRVEAETTP